MTLPRLQLFEFNDQAWAPAALRDTITDSLSRAQAWGHHLSPLVTPFATFLSECGATEVLDLCAGAGGPAVTLIDELLRANQPVPRFVLTDLFPHVAQWEALAQSRREALGFEPSSVDVTSIPEALGNGRARLIVNALHHFPPEVAREVLAGACRDAPGLFVVDAVARNPLRMLAMAPWGLLALGLSPLLAREGRLARALLTWATPVSLAASLWDACVSAMRAYTWKEVQGLLGPLKDSWRWEAGELRFDSVGRGIWFYGVPRA